MELGGDGKVEKIYGCVGLRSSEGFVCSVSNLDSAAELSPIL